MNIQFLLLILFPFSILSQQDCEDITEDFTGKCTLYYEGGELRSVQRYKKGIPHGKTLAYYQSGELKVEGVYKKGIIKEGTTLYMYYKDGTIEEENTASYGLVTVREYHENGQLRTTGQIAIENPARLSHRIGTWKTYDKEGKLIFETYPEERLTRIISDE